MNIYQEKYIYFSGVADKVPKEELLKYFAQFGAKIVDDIERVNLIIEGKFTPEPLSDKIYELKKSGIDVLGIEEVEREFSAHLDTDSVLMAVKLSNDNERILALLKNSYFDNETFLSLLKGYVWGDIGIFDSDSNRDVCTQIILRFFSNIDVQHNIEYSPVGVYYVALEASHPKLLEVLYSMPDFRINDKDVALNQPISLKEVVALNPNIHKSLQMQILKNGKRDELKFLRLNESVSDIIKQKIKG